MTWTQLEFVKPSDINAMVKPEMQKVSIIIPAKNEERSLKETVTRTIKSMVDSNIDFEVLLIDDGSSDNTIEVAKNLAVEDSRITVIRNHSNHGKGFSLQKGFCRASNGVIVVIDADGQHIPEEIPKLFWPILKGEAHVVLGSRFLNRCNVVPIRHLLGNKVVSFCFNLLYGTNFSDVLMGFRAFSRDALDLTLLQSNGYLVEIEMLRNAVMKAVRISEVQSSCLYPKKSSVFRGIIIITQIVAGIFHLRLTHK